MPRHIIHPIDELFLKEEDVGIITREDYDKFEKVNCKNFLDKYVFIPSENPIVDIFIYYFWHDEMKYVCTENEHRKQAYGYEESIFNRKCEEIKDIKKTIVKSLSERETDNVYLLLFNLLQTNGAYNDLQQAFSIIIKLAEKILSLKSQNKKLNDYVLEALVWSYESIDKDDECWKIINNTVDENLLIHLYKCLKKHDNKIKLLRMLCFDMCVQLSKVFVDTDTYEEKNNCFVVSGGDNKNSSFDVFEIIINEIRILREELDYRPPSMGGSKYEEAKKDFENMAIEDKN